jgi:hypothetical protein
MLSKVELLWERMTELYGNKWINHYGEQPSKLWSDALDNVTPQQIGGAFKKLLTGKFKSFVPTLAEFIELCLPQGEDFGLPTVNEAFKQAVMRQTDKHPAVVYCLRQMTDVVKFRESPTKEAEKIFNEAWAKTVEHIANGGALPEREKQIESKQTGDSVKNKQAGEQALAELRTLFK